MASPRGIVGAFLASITMALGFGLAPASAQVDPVPLSPVKQLLEQGADIKFDPFSVLVRFDLAADPAAIERAIALVDGRVAQVYDVVPGLVHLEIGVPVDRALAALNQLKCVRYAEPDWVCKATSVPNDSNFGSLWGMRNTGQTVNSDPGVAGADSRAHLAWDTFTGSSTFVVAIIDDGTNRTHPDLAANIWSNPGEIAGDGIDNEGNGYVDDTWGYDFYQRDNNPSGTGHGTHTAGTVGAVGNNGVGVAGVMWSCKLMALRFLGPNGGVTSDAILSVQYANGKRVRVSNNSWGGGGFSQALYDAINAGKAANHLFVAASGNSGINSDSSPAYPGAYNLDNIINVAATDNNDGRASFSNYGATAVDIGAPGVNILSTYGNSGYSYLNGTSMACPHVAGAVALVTAANPTLTYAQVRSRILSTARPVASLSGRCVTGGVVDIAAAIAGSGGGGGSNTAPTVAISSPTSGGSFTAGAAITFTGTATDTQDGSLTASMTWSSSLQGTIGTGATFTRTDLIAGTHVITARATDSGSLQGSASVTITVTSGGSVPAAPGGLVVTVSGTTVTVRWTDNSSNETGFTVRRQKRVGNTWTSETVVATTGANVTQITDAPGLGRWRYSVQAFNGTGTSVWTGWVQVNVN
jgi:subtilisin family serine protease